MDANGLIYVEVSIRMDGQTKIAILISPLPRELDMSKVANAYDLN
jgi:hypothetical protein